MSSEGQHSGAGHTGKGYEPSDANVRALVWWGLGVFLLIAAGVTVSAVVFHYFTARQALGPPPTPFENARTLPPAPQLQVYPGQDLIRYREHERKILESYGWVDQKAGVVRIPIERAMDLLLQRGLPARSAPPAGRQPVASGSAANAASGSGHTP